MLYYFALHFVLLKALEEALSFEIFQKMVVLLRLYLFMVLFSLSLGILSLSGGFFWY